MVLKSLAAISRDISRMKQEFGLSTSHYLVVATEEDIPANYHGTVLVFGEAIQDSF